ncbi:MAG: hypothetical protein KJ955_07350 [Nanoarchaeota archaeon]|nr:hypothetical protein [Nanoarchaeota archaeon]
MRCKSLLALIPAAIISAADTNAEAVTLPTLTCEDVFTISAHGTDFYACHEDVFPSPADSYHTRRFYETIDLISRVKLYGRKELGFQETANYREYRPGAADELAENDSVSYMLYIIPKFQITIEPERSRYIALPIEYRNDVTETTILYSRRDNFEDEEAYYRAEGFDVFRRVVVNFSSTSSSRPGCSITDEFMKDPIARQIMTPIHEDWHFNRMQVWGHIYIPRIEESLASLVGFAGTVDFSEIEFGTNSKPYEQTVEVLNKWKWRADFTVGYYEELSALYAMDIPEEEMEERKREFMIRATREWNAMADADRKIKSISNATLMRDLPYTWFFERAYSVYEAHPDMRELVRILKDTPDDEEQAIEYLERFSTPNEERQQPLP